MIKKTEFMLNTPPIFYIVLSDNFLFYNYFQSANSFSTIEKKTPNTF